VELGLLQISHITIIATRDTMSPTKTKLYCPSIVPLLLPDPVQTTISMVIMITKQKQIEAGSFASARFIISSVISSSVLLSRSELQNGHLSMFSGLTELVYPSSNMDKIASYP
jgi:hypothetical protein